MQCGLRCFLYVWRINTTLYRCPAAFEPHVLKLPEILCKSTQVERKTSRVRRKPLYNPYFGFCQQGFYGYFSRQE